MSAIILASKSAARQAMMTQAGVDFDCIAAHIDEEKIQAMGGAPQDISRLLAEQKALSVSKNHEGKYIIGSDQVLSMKEKIYSKAKDKTEAREKLREFSGKSHCLTSSVVVAKNSKIIFSHTDQAILKMKPLSQDQIEDYIAKAGEVLTQCVGGYAIEGYGIRLFEEIKGDYFTILGMPLLPLLNFLEAEEVLK